MGEYDCFAVKLQVRSRGVVALEHRLWFSNDANRYVVKYDAGGATMELTKVEQGDNRSAEQPYYRDQELGIMVRTPKDWGGFAGMPAAPGRKLVLQLKQPARLDAACYFDVKDRRPSIATARQALEEAIKVPGTYFKSYVVRKDSWKERAVCGLPAGSMIADYEGKVITRDAMAKPGGPDKAIVEYRVSVLGPKYIYAFGLQAEKDAFEKAKAEFDKVLDMFEFIPPSK